MHWGLVQWKWQEWIDNHKLLWCLQSFESCVDGIEIYYFNCCPYILSNKFVSPAAWQQGRKKSRDEMVVDCYESAWYRLAPFAGLTLARKQPCIKPKKELTDLSNVPNQVLPPERLSSLLPIVSTTSFFLTADIRVRQNNRLTGSLVTRKNAGLCKIELQTILVLQQDLFQESCGEGQLHMN